MEDSSHLQASSAVSETGYYLLSTDAIAPAAAISPPAAEAAVTPGAPYDGGQALNTYSFAEFQENNLGQDLLGGSHLADFSVNEGFQQAPGYGDEAGNEAGTPPAAAEKPSVAVWRLILLPCNLGAANLLAATLLVTIIPMQIFIMVGDEWKGTAQGITMALAVAVSIASGPISGYISDRTRSRIFGRRKPYIVTTAVLRVIFAILMVLVGSLPQWNLVPGLFALPFYSLLFIGVMFFAEIGNVPHRALIADLCPKKQFGAASALYAIYELVGGLMGAAIVGPLYVFIGPIPQIIVASAIMLIACALTCLAVLREPEPTPLQKRGFKETIYSFFQPFIVSSDFRLIFLVAFLIYFGINMIQLLSLFFMKDVVQTFTFFGFTLFTDPALANSLFLFIIMFGAALASGLGGGLSDLLGRKIFLYISVVLFIAGGLSMLFLSFSYVLVICAGVIMGMGIGCFGSVGYALATEILPNPEEAAKDLAMFALSGSVPQALASPFAGVTLDIGNSLGKYIGFPVLGYFIVWIFASMFVAVAGLVAIFIKKGGLDVKKLRDRFKKKPKAHHQPNAEADSTSSQDPLNDDGTATGTR